MAKWCLRPELAENFKSKLQSGEIDVEKLNNMESDVRRDFFKNIVGDDAEKVNTLFEKTHLLKDQEAGLIRWAKGLANIPDARREALLAKIKQNALDREQKIFSPKENEMFLRELAEDRLGVGVSREEANSVFELTRKIDEFKNAGEANKYGVAKVVLDNYINDIKLEAMKPKEALEKLKSSVKALPGLSKSLAASLDNSAIFRQGWKTIWTNPGIWFKNATKTYGTIAKSLAGKNMQDVIKAELYSRPNAMNGNYNRMKLAIGLGEEAYPSSLPEKIPVIKRLFKASKDAYEGFLYGVRADIADKYIKQAESVGIDINDKFQAESLGKVINALTGRSNRGIGKISSLNNVFFSPKLMQSHIDVLTGHAGDKISTFAKKKAATNLFKMFVGTAGMLKLADTMMPGSVEWDPRSSNFGKIKIGDTRFDVTGGTAQFVTLVARLAGGVKSSQTGAIKKWGAFGVPDGTEIISNFFENKLSPTAGIIRNMLNRKNFKGEELDPTKISDWKKEAVNAFTPLPFQTYNELKDNPNAANTVLSMIADMHGIGANTYSIENNWNKSTGKELTGFKQKIGQEKFDEANKEYNLLVNNKTEELLKDSRYKSLSDEDKLKAIDKLKDKIKSEVFKKYGYKYQYQRTPKNNTIEELVK